MTAHENDAPGVFPARGEVVFIRHLPGPIERVWRYLTESELRAQWLAAGTMDLWIGGAVELRFHHHELAGVADVVPEKYRAMAEGECLLRGRVTACEPPRFLSYTWNEDEGEVSFLLEPVGDRVRLTLRHWNLGDNSEALASVGGGWHTHLAILIARLTGDSPPPFWATHTRLEAEYAARLRGA